MLRCQKIDDEYLQNRTAPTPTKQKCDNLFDTEDDWGDGADDWGDSLTENSESFKDVSNLMTTDIDNNSENSKSDVSTENTNGKLTTSGADDATKQLEEMCLDDALRTNKGEITDTAGSSENDFEAMSECYVEDLSMEPESELLRDLLSGRLGEAEAHMRSDASHRFVLRVSCMAVTADSFILFENNSIECKENHDKSTVFKHFKKLHTCKIGLRSTHFLLQCGVQELFYQCDRRAVTEQSRQSGPSA